MKVAEIEGIGPAIAKRLEDAGFSSLESLLEAGGTPKGRREIASKTGISDN